MFGDRLKELRKSKHLKQSDLAKELDIGRTTLSNYELNNRQPDFNTLEKIANYFNVSIDYLVGRTNFKTLDEYVLHTDLKNLSEDYDNASPEIKRILVNTLDHIYLSISSCVNKNDVHLLSIIEGIYYCIYRINADFNSSNKALFINKLVESDVAVVQDKFKILSEYKNKLNFLLDELFQYYISNSTRL